MHSLNRGRRRNAAARLAACLVLGSMAIPAACSDEGGEPVRTDHRLLIMGIDGMDATVLGELMDAGRMPNFSRVAATGGFSPLATSAPAQSPVAWSNVISGADPGTHQLFDFIHRDPASERGSIVPFLSTSDVEPPARNWALAAGDWRIPLFGEETKLLRRGTAFWDHLIVNDVDTAIYRMPANYPAPEVEGSGHYHCICGMGTPDLMGTYGEFTYFTPDAPLLGRSVGGGRFVRLRMHDDRGTAALAGPGNYLQDPEKEGGIDQLKAALEVVRDPSNDVARITAGDETVVLSSGEWSDWVPIEFETGIPASMVLGAMQLPTAMPAMVRFYLKSVHPDVRIYVTPLNIDPLNQVNPIGSPSSFPEDVAKACGRYYTTGIPEDTKALRSDALNEDEFLSQVNLLVDERLAQFRHALDNFDRGCLFFYFGHVDQLSHIFWRDRDPDHPAHDPDEAARYGTVIEDAYLEMDELLGEVLERLDDEDTLVIMSDHGFTSFRRGFNLNTWLVQNGYITLDDPQRQASLSYLAGIDWSKTRAYGLGLNALYANLAGREADGIVAEGDEHDALLREIAAKLVEVRDEHGAPVVDTVHIVKELYPGADPDLAPDLLIGYADYYRASWSTAEGGMPLELFEDNFDRWSGDHCIAEHIVPGILVTNRRIEIADPTLTDLAPTFLGDFGLPVPDEMTGRDLFRRDGATRVTRLQ